MKCRFCDTELVHMVVDLGMTPLSNAFLEEASLDKKEPFYPITCLCLRGMFSCSTSR